MAMTGATVATAVPWLLPLNAAKALVWERMALRGLPLALAGLPRSLVGRGEPTLTDCMPVLRG